MATLTIRVTVISKDLPYTTDQEETSCLSTLSVFVPVPSGQTRFIEIASSDVYGIASTSYTINEGSIITIELTGSINQGDPSQNTIFSSSYIKVSIASGQPIYYSKGITRQHTGNIC
jgi:hypothetical protein